MAEKERSRINEFWAGRNALTKAEFVADFLPHPDIDDRCHAEICAFVFGNRDSLRSIDQLLTAVNALNTVGWPCGVSAHNFAPIPIRNKEPKMTLNELIAGVTHFEVDQIVWLDHRFWERCDRRSLSISDTAFVSCVLSATKRSEVAGRVFRLFNEHSNSAIGFKEYVCGLSSLCCGPEAERMKFTVGLWDSDMDGVLSHNDLAELAEFFGFSLDLLAPHFVCSTERPQQRQSLHIFDFVCLASKCATLRETLLAFSDKVWVALTSSTKSPSATTTHSITSSSTFSAAAAAAVGGDALAPNDDDNDNSSSSSSSGEEEDDDEQQQQQYQQQEPLGKEDDSGGYHQKDVHGDHGRIRSQPPKQQQQMKHSEETRRRRRLGGVRNIGNTCYLGAAIQTMANVSLLSGFLLSNEQHFLHLPLVRRYAQMLRCILMRKETASPVELKECVSTMCTLFSDNLQHDSQEFIQFFLDALHELLRRTTNIAAPYASVTALFQLPQPSGVTLEQYNNNNNSTNKVQNNIGTNNDNDGTNDKQHNNTGGGRGDGSNSAEDGSATSAAVLGGAVHGKGGEMWQNATKHWDTEVLSAQRGSIVLALFAGQFLSMLHCPCCTHSSNTFELFTMLQLQIPISESLSLPFKLVRRCPAVPIIRHVLRIPTTIKIVHVKRLICDRIGIDASNVLIIILNKSDGKYNATLSQMFNGGSGGKVNSLSDDSKSNNNDDGGTLLMGIPLSDVDVWGFETTMGSEEKDDDGQHNQDGGDGGGHCAGDGGHLICVHRQFHFKSSYAVLALNGIATYTFGTPIVLTFSAKAVQKSTIIHAAELYKMVLDYVQKRYYHRINSERHSVTNTGGDAKIDGGVGGAGIVQQHHHHLFNRALDATADSAAHHQNAVAYPFELALTKTDTIWCYKCQWQRFCRGCPIDANSTDAFALDQLLADQCVLTINWTNIDALYLLYNNLAERFIDDSQRLSLSSSTAELLDDDTPRITIDDCLADFTRAERIDGSQCNRCKRSSSSSTPLIKQLSFTRLPETLVICLKRFTFVPSLRQFVKQNVPVSFPLDNFDPSKYFASDVPADILSHFSRYFCIAIVTHYGQLDYGHYCSYVRDSFTDEWFLCNDNRTFPIKSSEVDTRNAYIVFYQRVPSSSCSPPPPPFVP